MNYCPRHPYSPVPSKAPCPLCAAAPIIEADRIASLRRRKVAVQMAAAVARVARARA